MALLPIIIAPDPRLKVTAKPVKNVDESVRRLMDDMLETMYRVPGIGLAAPQVGIALRVFVADPSSGRSTSDLRVLVNPEIVEQEGDQREEEGCLSLPGFTARVARSTHLVLRGLDRDGTPVQLEAEGLQARVFQHEVDHLDGTIFVNRLQGIKRDLIVRRVRKLQRAGKW